MQTALPEDILPALKLQTGHLQTIGDVLDWTCNYFNTHQLFYGHGTDNAWDEALALFLPKLGLSYDCGREVLQQRLKATQLSELLELIVKRVHLRIPAPYLTEQAYFAGLKFYVDKRVLIPRSPLGELIQDQFTPWYPPQRIRRILDVGTGSGCLAIGCAYYLPHVQVDAADISADSLSVAKQNCEALGVADRVHLFQSDLFSALGNTQYDIIISNPPYVDADDMQAMPQEYWHEPRVGLAAGEDGLSVVLPLLRLAAEHLNEGGLLIVEVGNSEIALAERFPQIPFTWLEFSCGGDGVFLLTKEQLQEYKAILAGG